MTKKELRKIIKNIEAKVKPITVIVLLVLVSLTTIFVFNQNVTIVKGAGVDEFEYVKKITISHDYIDSTLTNFPILIHDDSGDIKDKVLSNASDIVFYSSDNLTQYNHEIELYNSGTGELTAWVNITSISNSADTILYMYYGDSDGGYTVGYNPLSVWDSDFSLVSHMNGTSNVYDSTSNDNTFTKYNTPTQSTGKIGYCQDFVRADSDRFDIADDNSLDIGTGDATFEFWLDIDYVSGNDYMLYATNDGDIKVNFWYNIDDTAPPIQFSPYIRDTNNDASNFKNITNITDRGFCYAVIQIDNSEAGTGNELVLFVNTTQLNAESGQTINWDGDSLSTTTKKCLGHNEQNYFYDGKMDEFRISLVKRSNAWLKASFHSGNQTTGFITLGSQGSNVPVSVYTLNGLTNNRITWSGTAGNTVWSNSSGDANEFMEINMSVNETDNISEIRIFQDDLNNSGEYVNASNISLYISSDNVSYALMGTFVDGGSNLTINKTTYPVGAGTNIFDGTGITNNNRSIWCKYHLTIPSEVSDNIFYASTSTSNKVYLGDYT